jgi:uncharacterized Tic20 family protein
MTENFHPLPQPSEIPEREKEDAMGAYLMMFAAVAVGLPLPVINLIAAIIYYFVNRGKSRFIHFHALQALLSQIPTTVINWVLVVWAFRIAFFDSIKLTDEFWAFAIFAAAATVFYFIISLIAAVKARRGRMYYFLFFGKVAYEVAFRLKETEGQPVALENRSPYQK